MRSPHLFVATALAAVALSAPAVVTAAEPVAVKYSDLDLGTAEGQAKLERRIDSAARTASIALRVSLARTTRNNSRNGNCLVVKYTAGSTVWPSGTLRTSFTTPTISNRVGGRDSSRNCSPATVATSTVSPCATAACAT